MDEEQSVSDISTETSQEPPAVTINYGVFEVSVFGGPNDSLDEVTEAADEQIEQALEHIEELKRMDYDLSEEYTNGGHSGPTRMSQ